jgi:hypothetical protein
MSFKEPLASTSSHGVVKIGNGISVNAGVISVNASGLLSEGYFYSTATQTNPVASAINIVSFNNVGISSGISIVTATQITVSKTGNYNLQFTVQLDKTDSGTDDVDIWVLKNGLNYPDTNTMLTLVGNNTVLLAGWSYILTLDAGDYVQLAWQSIDTSLRLFYRDAQVAPSRPVTPSARVTIVEL